MDIRKAQWIRYRDGRCRSRPTFGETARCATLSNPAGELAVSTKIARELFRGHATLIGGLPRAMRALPFCAHNLVRCSAQAKRTLSPKKRQQNFEPYPFPLDSTKLFVVLCSHRPGVLIPAPADISKIKSRPGQRTAAFVSLRGIASRYRCVRPSRSPRLASKHMPAKRFA